MSVPERFAADAMATAVVDEIGRSGVRHAVVAPGSRSTPLALALERSSDIHVHVVIDERSAAFVALGIGKATGAPAVALATSGTAAVNFWPAVVEASHARVPLLVFTADRPPELRDTGAGQTIDQLKLYGGFTRWFVEVGVAGDHPVGPAYWRSLAARAWHAARLDPPGPVHLNFAFREPLVSMLPAPPDPDDAGRPGPWARSIVGTRVPTSEDVGELGRLLDASERGLVIVGGRSVPGGSVRDLAERLSWPVIADVLSGARDQAAITTYEALLRSPGFVDGHIPEVVLQIGSITASRPLAALAARAARRIVVDEAGAWNDPERTASLLVAADPGRLCRDLGARMTPRAATEWLRSWSQAHERASRALAAVLDESELSEPRVARDVMRAVPDGASLMVSSSMPIRDLDWFSDPRPELAVFSNRGANGIDGVISSAAGIALGTGAPVVALVGDLAALHDQGALGAALRLGVTLVVVIVNNDGGGIFSFLPQRQLDAEFERLFATPQGADFEDLARASGARYRRVETGGDLEREIEAAIAVSGVTMLEARTDRNANVTLHARLWTAVDAALS